MIADEMYIFAMKIKLIKSLQKQNSEFNKKLSIMILNKMWNHNYGMLRTES